MISEEAFQLIIDRKTAEVVHQISTRLDMQYNEAFYLFCGSDTYRKLADEETKYWRESVPYILESFVSERANIPVNDDY